GVRADRGIVRLLGLPGDDAVFDEHLPGARTGAVHPVGGAHDPIVAPAFMPELLRIPPALAVQLPGIGAGSARCEELCLVEQRFDRLAHLTHWCEPMPAPRAPLARDAGA